MQYVIAHGQAKGASDKGKQMVSSTFRCSAGVIYVLALVTIVCATRLLMFFKNNSGAIEYELTIEGQWLVRRTFYLIAITFMLALIAASASVFIAAYGLIGDKFGTVLIVVAVLAGLPTVVIWAFIAIPSGNVFSSQIPKCT